MHTTNNIHNISKNIYVNPSEMVLNHILYHMLPIEYDTIYFEAIYFESGICTIYAKFNQILGSVLLAIIEKSEIEAILNEVK